MNLSDSATKSPLWRKPTVLGDTGLKHATFQQQIADGVFPPPVKISKNCSAWPAHEVQAIKAARIAGKSEREIRDLVSRLVAARKAVCDSLSH